MFDSIKLKINNINNNNNNNNKTSYSYTKKRLIQCPNGRLKCPWTAKKEMLKNDKKNVSMRKIIITHKFKVP